MKASRTKEPAFRAHVRRAVSLFGSQGLLGEAIGRSQQQISALCTEEARMISAEDALAIEVATKGRVSASDMRPDIWPTPKDSARAAKAAVAKAAAA